MCAQLFQDLHVHCLVHRFLQGSGYHHRHRSCRLNNFVRSSSADSSKSTTFFNQKTFQMQVGQTNAHQVSRRKREVNFFKQVVIQVKAYAMLNRKLLGHNVCD